MNKCILVGIDADISHQTQHTLHVVSNLFVQFAPQLSLTLLHVIPVPYVTSARLGRLYRLPPTAEQRTLAENALRRARLALHKQGIPQEQVKILLRFGMPADEIVKAARELEVDFIVIGSRGNSFKQKVRRFLAGSTSRRVLQLASCPVMIVTLPQMSHPRNLVAWYKESITRYLSEHPGSLTVFTSYEVAQMFAPPDRTVGSKEVDAASIALEQLSCKGLLFCHKVKGELRYIND